MVNSIKSEFLKLFTVRSTYIMSVLALALLLLFTFFFEGYKGNTGSPASTLQPTALHEIATNSIGLVVIFVSIIAILLVAHEYRYNTIMYTLTANVRRSQVLLAKVFAITVFSAGFAIVSSLVALGSYMLGLSLRDASLPAQDFSLLAELGKAVFYSACYALLALVIAFIVRSVVAAIAIFLIFPTTLEPLLGIVLKDNSKYLPFAALDSIVGTSLAPSALSPGKAMAVSSVYIILGLLVAWLLFVRRDAN